jgi:hypothetical protein
MSARTSRVAQRTTVNDTFDGRRSVFPALVIAMSASIGS